VKQSKWTKEACVAEALKYKTRTDWAKKSGSSYNVAAENGWIDACCGHMVAKIKPNGFWTKKQCRIEAKKFESRSDWAKGSGTSYNTALANGWLEECCSHMIRKMKPMGYWTKKQCQLEARKYNSSSEWQSASGASYGIAREKGWLKECTAHMTPKKMPNGYWDKQRCQTEAKKYNSKVDFSEGSMGAYHAALKNNWIDEICSHMSNDRRHDGYTEEELFIEAKKYQTKRDFRDAAEKKYLWALRHNLIDKICSHMKPLGSRAKRQLYVFEHPDKTAYVGLTYDAQKRYDQHINSKRVDTVGVVLRQKKKEFGDRQVFKVFPGFFSQEEAIKEEQKLVKEYESKGWKMLNTAKAGSLGGNTAKYTLEECIKIARKCKKRRQLEQLNASAYRAILKNGWQDKCFAHMVDGKIDRYADEHLISVIAKVDSLTELRAKYPLEYRAASRRPQFREWTEKLDRQRKLHTPEEIFRAAKKCKTRLEFFKRFGDEYRAAKRRGIFEEAVAHMKKRKSD